MGRRAEKLASYRAFAMERSIRKELEASRETESQGSIYATQRYYEADVYSRRMRPTRNNHQTRGRDTNNTRTPKRG